MPSEIYNKACEMVLQYLAGHIEDFKDFAPDFKQPFPSDQVSEAVPLFKQITAKVQSALNYELSEFQCSWAVSVHYRHGLGEYNKFNNLELQPLTLGE